VGTAAVATLLGRIAAVGSVHPVHVNGFPALMLRIDGEVAGVLAVRMEGGLITGLYAVRNPEKLSHLRREAVLQRG
jgi:RNA polymerase sigma-70 factor (ECF subfamily)